jgi:hypothetical protein
VKAPEETCERIADPNPAAAPIARFGADIVEACRTAARGSASSANSISAANPFPNGPPPACTCVGVTGVAYDALIEIDSVARRPS